MGRIALTGAASFLGARTLRRLLETKEEGEILVLDIAEPPTGLGVAHRKVDLTEPASDQQLLDVLREEEIETVVHMAFFTSPQRDTSYAHELESIGTLNVLAASAAAGVRHVVLRSFTAVYGARGANPNFLTEERALTPNSGLSWVRDKLEAEQHAASFARRYPEMTITVLRLAPLFGPGVRTFYTRIFDRRVIPVVMGYDPLFQLLHPEDALRAVEAALATAPKGAVNVVPLRTISLIRALHLAGKIPIPIPHPIAYAASDALWASGVGPAPGAFVDYARYLCVADGAKAEAVMGFRARYDSREAMEAYLRYRYPVVAEAAVVA